MTVFCDTDALIKVSSLELSDVFLDLFDAKHCDVHVLKRELKVLQSNDIIDDYGKSASEAAVIFANGCSKLTTPDPAEFMLLQAVIDPGEATMFACTKGTNPDWIVTGDGRALRALAGSNQCGAVTNRINGKVVCFDQVLLGFLGKCGFNTLRQKVSKARIPDIALRNIFGNASQATKQSVEFALKSRVDDLRADTGNLLTPYSL